MRKFGSEGADIIETKINTRDLLTQYDKEVQDVICSKIKSNFPNHQILGEEDVAPGADAAQRRPKKFLWQVLATAITTLRTPTTQMAIMCG